MESNKNQMREEIFMKFEVTARGDKKKLRYNYQFVLKQKIHKVLKYSLFFSNKLN